MKSYIALSRFAFIFVFVWLLFYFINMGSKTWNPIIAVNHLKDESKATLDDRIYFLETSGRSSLSFRQSCAAESAARQNPNRPVRVYMLANELNYTSRSMELLGEYNNVAIESLDLDKYFNNTPLERWYRNGTWRNSPHSVAHLSDYLRILSVYKEGGLYLDLDFVVTKPFRQLGNYLVLMDNYHICNGVFQFEKEHVLVGKIIESLANAYDPKDWAAHGPLLLTHITYSNCNVTNGLATGHNCGLAGVQIVNSSMYFPVYYPEWRFYYDNRSSDELPEMLTKAIAIHMWNKESSREPVYVGSSQYYALLAAKYCPLSYAAALHIF